MAPPAPSPVPPADPAAGNPPLRVLVVEDSALDCELVVIELALQGWPCRHERVETLEALAASLAGQAWDLVISDHGLPGFTSTQVWEQVRALPEPPPFIIVSGQIGEDAAVQALQRGADDYLVKGRLARLGSAVRNALAAASARREAAASGRRADDYRRQLQALSAQLQAVRDEERTRLAREIHDDIGGILAAVRFDLEAALREQGCEACAGSRIPRALEELRQAQQAAQRLIRDLRPPILDAGVVAALQWHAASVAARHGLALTFEGPAQDPQLPPAMAMALYRAGQEILTNVAKHARARAVRVDLHADAGLLSLAVEDDGCGFDASAPARPDAFGLRGLRERLHAMDGGLEITSGTHGTSVLAWVPLEPLP